MADVFGEFKTKLSEHLTNRTCRELCAHFMVSPAKTESILSKEPPGLALIDHLESESKLTPNNLQELHDALMHLNLVQAAQLVEEFARKTGAPPLTLQPGNQGTQPPPGSRSEQAGAPPPTLPPGDRGTQPPAGNRSEQAGTPPPILSPGDQGTQPPAGCRSRQEDNKTFFDNVLKGTIETEPRDGLIAGESFQIIVRSENVPAEGVVDITITGVTRQDKVVPIREPTDVSIDTYGKFTLHATYKKSYLGSKEIYIQPSGCPFKKYCNIVQPYDALVDEKSNTLVVLSKGKITSFSIIRTCPEIKYEEANFTPFAIASLFSYYFVTDTNNKKILLFDKKFVLQNEITHESLTAPTGIAANEKLRKIFVANKAVEGHSPSSILVLDEWGHVQSKHANNVLKNPWSVKINSMDQLLVSDESCIRVFKLPDFIATTTFKIQPFNGQNMRCRGMDIDKENNIFVAERGEGYRTQFECISIYTETFDRIGYICKSEPPSATRKRLFMGIPKLGVHLDSVVEDVEDRLAPFSKIKEFHFVRGISLTTYDHKPMLVVVDAGNEMVRMIHLEGST